MNTPRITSEMIAANIVKEVYFTAADGILGASFDGKRLDQSVSTEHTLLTICVLTLRNGFTVLGKSACVSPENFDAEIGRSVAREDAFDQIWPLMGYALKSELAGL